MGNGMCTSSITNIESPFTELFSLIKRYEVLPDESSTLVYQTDELKALRCHADNAMNIILQGLQDIGNLFSMVAQSNDKILHELQNVGFLIAGMSNLAEALDTLRLDIGFVLQQRGV